MSRQLLYIFGEPGTGKITVARILQKRLGWRLFWLHDLDLVSEIVGRYPLPRLMDRVSEAVLEELMSTGEDLIYVRPSRETKTRRGVAAICARHDYTRIAVQLIAPYETLVERVTARGESRFRAGSKADLDRYLKSRPGHGFINAGEYILSTWDKSPEQAADNIEVYLKGDNTDGSNR